MFVFCAVLFFIAAPTIILYTAGFRYSAEAKKIIQTGIIYLTIKPPEGIKIFADGKEVKENLITHGVINKEYILNSLIPKSYNVKISKEGFWTWEKNLAVSKGLITYAMPLLLPLNPKNELLVADYIGAWSASPDFTKISYFSYKDEKVSVVVKNLISGKTQEKPLEQPLDLMEGANILWSPDSQNFAIIFPKSPRCVIFGSEENEIMNLTELNLNGDIFRGLWNEKSDLFVYFSGKSELYALNPRGSEAARKIADNAAGFGLLNNDIYYLNSANSFIYKTSLDNPESKEQVSFAPIAANINGSTSLPLDFAQGLSVIENTINPELVEWVKGEAEIVISQQGRIAVVTSEKKLLILNESGVPAYLNSGVETVEFSQNGQDLLYNSDFEIFAYSPKNSSRQLITRLSQKVKNVAWYKDYNHIWFTHGNILKNIELDQRSSRNVYDFLSFTSEPKQIIYDNISNAVYYDRTDGNKLSIYRVKAE